MKKNGDNQFNKIVFFNVILLIIFLIGTGCQSTTYHYYRDDIKEYNYGENQNKDNNLLNKKTENYKEISNKNEELSNTSKKDKETDQLETSEEKKSENLKIKRNFYLPLKIERQYQPQLLFIIGNISYYTVKKGDTLYSIAKKFNISFKQLIKLNRLKSYKIKPGDKIKISKNGLKIYSPVKDFIINFKTLNIVELKIKSDNKIFSPLQYSIVDYVGFIRGFGLTVILKYNNYYLVMSNMDKIAVKKGDRVNINNLIGITSIGKPIKISLFYGKKIINLKNYLIK